MDKDNFKVYLIQKNENDKIEWKRPAQDQELCIIKNNVTMMLNEEELSKLIKTIGLKYYY